MTDKEFVKHFIEVEKDCDKGVLHQVINCMDEKMAERIIDEYEKNEKEPTSEAYSFLTWRRYVRKPVEMENFHKNERVDELLERYATVIGKEMEPVRDALRTRFDYMSFAEQKKVVRAFLTRGYVNDMVYCCKVMNDAHWKKEYLDILEPFFVRMITHNTKKAYVVAKVIVRHSSQEFIRESIGRLDYEGVRGDLMMTLQVLLMACKEDPKKVLKQAKLEPDDYVYVMAKRGKKVSEEEARMALDVTMDGPLTADRVRVMSWAVAQMGYLEVLLDFAERLKRKREKVL